MDKSTKEVVEVYLTHFKENLNEVKSTLKDILITLSKHESTLLRNTITVEDHKRRSDLSDAKQEEFLRTQREMVKTLSDLTNKLNQVETDFNSKLSNVESDIEPIKNHVKKVTRLFKLLTIIDENKWTIAKIIGFIIAIILAVKTGHDYKGFIW